MCRQRPLFLRRSAPSRQSTSGRHSENSRAWSHVLDLRWTMWTLRQMNYARDIAHLYVGLSRRTGRRPQFGDAFFKPFPSLPSSEPARRSSCSWSAQGPLLSGGIWSLASTDSRLGRRVRTFLQWGLRRVSVRLSSYWTACLKCLLEPAGTRPPSDCLSLHTCGCSASGLS